MSSEKTASPTALTPAQAAKVLSAAAGRRIEEAAIRRDLEAGAPRNPNGTLNLVQYAAWLVKEYASRGD